MTQTDLDRAVAHATGESLSTVSCMGFVPLTRVPFEKEPKELMLDWDDLDGDRRLNVFPRRNPLPAVA